MAHLAGEQALVRAHLSVVEVSERWRESDRHIVRSVVADIVRHAAMR